MMQNLGVASVFKVLGCIHNINCMQLQHSSIQEPLLPHHNMPAITCLNASVCMRSNASALLSQANSEPCALPDLSSRLPLMSCALWKNVALSLCQVCPIGPCPMK